MSRLAPIRRTLASLIARAIVPPLIVLVFSAPVMACMMEAATLSVSEAECCRQMRGECLPQVLPHVRGCGRCVRSGEVRPGAAGSAGAHRAPGRSAHRRPVPACLGHRLSARFPASQ
jgi:hypothetical protein